MTEEKKPLNIGLVMPIAPIDGCSAEHWLEVKRIINESVATIPGYHCEPKIVSEGDSIGLIHKRIIEGLYKSDIVICDVSCKNPNVMFELGIRLAFDKPTVIIKDDLTEYAFDTGVIEHVTYPRDLHYSKIVSFKELLAQKVLATYEDSLKDPQHSPFLKSFGTFTVAKVKEDTVSENEFIIKTLQDLQSDMNTLKHKISPTNIKPHQIVDESNNRATVKEYQLSLTSIKKYLDQLTKEQLDAGVNVDDITEQVIDSLRRNGYDTSYGRIFNLVTSQLAMNKIKIVSE